MDRSEMPALVELESVVLSNRTEFMVYRSRYLFVSITVLPAEVTLHVIEAVGRPFDSLDMVRFRIRDERGTVYPMRSGGSGGSVVSGSPRHLLEHFARPDQHRPQQFTVKWERTGPGGTSSGEVGVFAVESRRG